MQQKKLQTVTIRPARPDLALRLFQNTGLREWHYQGKPEPGFVNHQGVILEVWLVKAHRIVEQEVVQHMIKETMRVRSWDEAQATEWVKTHDQAFPAGDLLWYSEAEAQDMKPMLTLMDQELDAFIRSMKSKLN